MIITSPWQGQLIQCCTLSNSSKRAHCISSTEPGLAQSSVTCMKAYRSLLVMPHSETSAQVMLHP